MSKSKVQLNAKGFQELRQTPAVRKLLMEKADQLQKQASDNGRVQGYIITDLVLEEPRGAVSIMATGHAKRHNRKTHALVRALIAQAGR